MGRVERHTWLRSKRRPAHSATLPQEKTMPDFPRLFEPLQIGNFTVRNRIVNTTHGTAHSEQRDLRYLQERARGGAALIGSPLRPGLQRPAGP